MGFIILDVSSLNMVDLSAEYYYLTLHVSNGPFPQHLLMQFTIYPLSSVAKIRDLAEFGIRTIGLTSCPDHILSV